MRQAVPIAIGVALAALSGSAPARAQYWPRPYPYYYPAPVYPPAYYPPPPVYRYVPPPVYSPPVYSPPVYAPAPPRPSASLMETQRSLAQLGYDPGPVDGLPGPRLTEAVQAFQRDHEQAANGRLSGETIGAIREAARVHETQVVPVPSSAPPSAPPLGQSSGPAPAFDASRYAPPAASGSRPTLSVKPSSP